MLGETALADGILGKVVSDGFDWSWSKIKKMIENKKKNDSHENYETMMYGAVVDALNQITANQHKGNQDKIYQAAESLMKDWKSSGKLDIVTVRSGLIQVRGAVSEEVCSDFISRLNDIIVKNQVLFNLIMLKSTNSIKSNTTEILQNNKEMQKDSQKQKDDLKYIIKQNDKICDAMLREEEREFVVTHNANIKPASYFTGRETELQDLRQRMEGGLKSVLVSGMGGIGKTHICRKLFSEYVAMHKKKEEISFEHIGYIEYDSNIDSSLENCLKYKKQDNLKQNQEAAWRELEYLASEGTLLLFVDNVDKTIRQDSGLKRLSSIPGAMILTSRQTSISNEFEQYHIGFLEKEQCKDIYEKIRYEGSKKKVKDAEREDLNYIIENLVGRHTITIEFLAKLARVKLWSVKKLRQQLENNRFKMQYHEQGDLINIQESYETLYNLSELTEGEQNILEAFSVFPYHPLSVEVCNQWLLFDAGVGEEADLLAGLYRKGWLQFDIEQESYILHPVFAQFIYDKCKPAMKNHAGLVEACQEALIIPKSGSALKCQQYIPFVEKMVEKLLINDEIEKAKLLSGLAFLLNYIGEYSRTEELNKKSLEINERVLGENNPDTAISYNNLAAMYEKQGEYGKAEELLKKALEINERVLGEYHPNTALIYNNLAEVYDRQGEYGKAEELFKKILKIRERVLGDNPPDTASIYNNLAGVYYNQEEYGKAEELFKKSLELREKMLGKNHPETATSYNNLAGIYKKQGEYGKAEELFKKSLKIREQVLGDNHPETATSYNNLAGMYHNQGKYDKAEELYKKNLEIMERVLGENHPNTVNGYNDLAEVYFNQGKYDKAEELFKKNLEIMERVLGENHPDTANSYYNLAGVYNKQGKNKIAIEYCIKAYEIFYDKLGESHPNTNMALSNLIKLYLLMNPNLDVEQWLEEQRGFD